MGLIRKSDSVGSGGLGKFGAGTGTGIAPVYRFHSKSDPVGARLWKGTHEDMVAVCVLIRHQCNCV